MAFTDNEKIKIKEYLNLSKSSVLDTMTPYLDQKIKTNLDNQAIEIVARNHNYDFEDMKSNVDGTRGESIFGGEVAAYYFELLRNKVESLIENEKELLRQAVCINFKYCEQRTHGLFDGEEYSLALAIADSLIAYLKNFPFL
jgi:hypothetical protein